MQRDVNLLVNESWDVLVVGGGINGLMCARDAALRGLKVALVDKGDFGAASSAASLKIIHGGLRYLQHMDLARMKESIAERNYFMRAAPHLIDPFPFLVPCYGHGMKGREAFRVALAINDIMSRQRNQGIDDPERVLPRGKVIDPKACLREAPLLHRKGLTGGALFYDGRMYNAERVNICVARSAVADGACLVNYMAVESFTVKNGCVEITHLRDQLSGEAMEIHAKQVLFLGGPWTDLLPRLLSGKPDRAPPPVVKSAGIQIITPMVPPGKMGLAVESKYIDPDSKAARGRSYFTTPWRGKTIWGTTDTPYKGDPDQWTISDQDVASFVDEINEALPGLGLSTHQVSRAFGGLRPMNPELVGKGSQVARKAGLKDYTQSLGIRNVLSLEGVKYTTARNTAERVIDYLFTQKLGYDQAPVCRTAARFIWGGDFRVRDAMRQDIATAFPQSSRWVQTYILRHFGSAYGELKEGSLAPVKGSEEVPEAAIRYAVRHEMAVRLEDVIMRRTDLGTLEKPAQETLEAVANIMASELGWSEEQRQKEIDHTLARGGWSG